MKIFRVCFSLFLLALFFGEATTGKAAQISDVPDPNVWGVEGEVFALARVGDVIYLGGTFSNLVSRDGAIRLPARNLAAFNVDTGEPVDWRPSARGTVYALAASADGSTIYAGGKFTKINGLPCLKFAAISTAGDLVWSADIDDAVRCVRVSEGRIYLGGLFTQVNGSPRRALAALAPPAPGGTTATLLPWSAGVTSAEGVVTVYGLAVANGDVVAVGKFDRAKGQVNRCQARFDAQSGNVKGWDYHEAVVTRAVTTDGDNFYGALAGGGGRVVAWGPTGKKLWRKTGNGDVQAIAYGAGQVVAGGHFTEFDHRTIERLVSLNPGTGSVNTSWTPSPGMGGVLAVRFSSDKLFVGGAFQFVGNTLVRSFAPFSIDPNVAAGAATEYSDFPIDDGLIYDYQVEAYDAARDVVAVSNNAY